jgi:thioester reductase-like protein
LPSEGASFHNADEASKFQAEQLVQAAPAMRTTVYRPSVIVGDTQIGHATNFTGLYSPTRGTAGPHAIR